MSKEATHYTFTTAARILGITWSGVRQMVARGALIEAGDVRGIRTVTAESLMAAVAKREAKGGQG